MKGRAIVWGQAKGEVLFLTEPLSFYGGVDPETGRIVQAGHPQAGECVAGRIVVMERSTGSTVGAYSLLRLKENGVAPSAIVVKQSDPVLVTGAALADIPLVDGVDIERLKHSRTLQINGDVVSTEKGVPEEASPPTTTEETLLLGGAVIKLGGSVITDKSSSEPKLNREVLLRLAQEIGRHQGLIAIVHGAGSFGHPLAKSLEGRELEDPVLIDWGRLQILQYRLDSEVAKALHFAGVPVYPIQVSAVLRGGDFHTCLTEVARTLVEHGFVPLMYGTPAVSADGPFIISGDDIVYSVAKALGYRLVIHVTDVDGVYDRNPSKPGAKLLDRVYSMEDLRSEDGDGTIDVTGSMAAKIRKALAAARQGIVTRIINGYVPGELLEALRGGEVGTRIG